MVVDFCFCFLRHKAHAFESERVPRERRDFRGRGGERIQMTDVASTSSLGAMLNNTSSSNSSNSSKKKVVPVRQYLDESVVPCLREAMKELVKVRPEDPHEFLAKYLMKHNPNQQQHHQHQQQQQQTTTTTGQKMSSILENNASERAAEKSNDKATEVEEREGEEVQEEKKNEGEA